MAKKMLVAYYSWSNGNTEKVAEQLADACGADLERIETVEPYPEDYDQTVQQGQDEVNSGFQPEICPFEHDPADYDVIAVGTPTWWYTMAPAVRTFLAETDLTGKELVLFATHGGWPGHALADMKACAKGAKVIAQTDVQFDSTGGDRQETPMPAVTAWAEKLK